ncbi:hypothetical protein [Rufibacter sp. LB8]|uniref:hypothetical protein n=1 Tax=Rufibacter sp. LB8 TaxID=2777781 RepID=UPI00178C82F1|nr:hypothetical protein [Rufibacter sp. LB8]
MLELELIDFKVPEIIAIADIFVNTLLVIALGFFIQKNQVNSRSLKDYFIKEVDKVHNDIITFLELLEGTIKPKDTQNYFTLHTTKLNTITKIIDERYKIDSNILVRELLTLQLLIESDPRFIRNYSRNRNTNLSQNSVSEISYFRSTKLKLFHESIMKVNDYSNFKIKFS